MNKLILIDKSTKDLLAEFNLGQEDLAYNRAVELEKLNIEVEVIKPNSLEQLGIALGAKTNEIDKLRCEMNDEIDSHLD